MLGIANPDGIGTDTSPGAYGVGDPFAFPMQSVEVVLPAARRPAPRRQRQQLSRATTPATPAPLTTPNWSCWTWSHGRAAAPSRHDATVIGHRGASGYRPEHTLAAYELAIRQCADFIEPDLVSTRDGVLVARHENEISGTTNIASRPEFAGRRTTKVIDGVSITGWFTEDFTLAELRTLRAIERLPDVRPQNTAFNGLYVIPTLDEVVDLARRSRTCDGKPVGVYPETKHPTYFDSIGLSLEEPLLPRWWPTGTPTGSDPVIIQSFETANLRELDRLTRGRPRPARQLLRRPLRSASPPATPGPTPTSSPAPGWPTSPPTPTASALCKDVMIPRRADGTLGAPTGVIRAAHKAAASSSTGGRSVGRTSSSPPSSAAAPTPTRPVTSSARSKCSSPPAWTASSPTTPTSASPPSPTDAADSACSVASLDRAALVAVDHADDQRREHPPPALVRLLAGDGGRGKRCQDGCHWSHRGRQPTAEQPGTSAQEGQGGQARVSLASQHVFVPSVGLTLHRRGIG